MPRFRHPVPGRLHAGVYDARFAIHFTPEEKAALVAFLNKL